MTTAAPPASANIANTDQFEYWNGETSEKWVTHRDVLDASLAEMADLLLRAADPRVAERVIDIGCGTGATSRRLAERVAPGGEVVALDLSGPMLELARTEPRENLSFLQADAQSFAFARGAADLATSRAVARSAAPRFGVMFFADAIAAFANIRAGLRAGGRFAFVCWAPLRDNPWFFEPLEIVARRLGQPTPPEPGAPGPFSLAECDYVAELLCEAGFASVEVEAVATRMGGQEDGETAARFACRMGPASRLLLEREPDAATLAAIVAEIAAKFRSYQTAEGIVLPALVNLATAVNPGA